MQLGEVFGAYVCPAMKCALSTIQMPVDHALAAHNARVSVEFLRKDLIDYLQSDNVPIPTIRVDAGQVLSSA